ncbi:MAG TPA: energy-coupling factor transporter ATPase [Candidatus Binatia bacterium]|nr:energy-coupling factor transporter ATPase [Candidatus Binatia bacterium]
MGGPPVAERATSGPPTGDEPLIEVAGLSCRYSDGTLALAGVDLEVRAGEIVAVMGASGAGKSTLLQCLSRVIPTLEPADVAGTQRLFGEPADSFTVADLAGRIGVVFQDFESQLFSTNVALEIGFGLDQLGVPAREIRRRAAEALERVGLAGFARRDPATLSGGEKQRLAMAAIWALAPEVILLDEPTTDIDPLGKRAVFDLLRAFRDAGAAIVVVEHEPEAAEIADRLLVLERGRVRAAGPAHEVARRVDVLAACGVRPRELDVVAAGLGIERRLVDVDDAEDELRRRGLASPRPDRTAPAGAPTRSTASSPVRAGASSVGAPRSPALADVQDLRHVYPDGTVALDRVSLAIGAGEFVALVGHNGSGKTTLAQHLTGLLLPTAGAVRVAGRDTASAGAGWIARHVGFVFQDPDHQLFSATVEDEVAFGPRHLALAPEALAERVARCLERTGLADKRDADPFLLSKGERQRLAVASVLALEPSILLLDEPTTGLDDREQRSLMDLLRDLQRSGTAVVAITHAPWLVAAYAERAVLLAHGRIAFDGPVADLFAAPDRLARAAFDVPASAALGMRLGIPARSPDELVRALRAYQDGP